MSTQAPKPRTSEEIKQEFNNVAFRSGHLQHEISNKEKDLKLFNESLVQLQVEYNMVKQQEDATARAIAEAKEAEAKAAAEPKAPEPETKAPKDKKSLKAVK